MTSTLRTPRSHVDDGIGRVGKEAGVGVVPVNTTESEVAPRGTSALVPRGGCRRAACRRHCRWKVLLVEVGAFLFGVLLKNPFSCSRCESNMFSRTQTMFAETLSLLILDELFLGLGRLHASYCMSRDKYVF